MSFSTCLKSRVAHANVAMDMAFSRSVCHWHKDYVQDVLRWRTCASDCGPLLISERDAVVLLGDCTGGVDAPDGGVIHIGGDLASKLIVGGHHEIVIAGSVRPGATIEASGFCDLFVGGNFAGELRSNDSTKVWIEGDFDGLVTTGSPSTNVYVGKDYRGEILPTRIAALLYLIVGGFAPQHSLSQIADCGYTEFNASVAVSDVAPGIYPDKGHSKETSHGWSHNRWCVLATRGSNGR